MTTPGRLEVAPDGRITGPATLQYNDPFPCVNGTFGSGAIQGVVMHTMVGNLPGTIAVFNQPGFDASAHFGIAQDGTIHQFGPIGHGWIAWAQEAGNGSWYSIEHADNGSTGNPLTTSQVTASAQLLEVLSRFAGFPLRVTDSTEGQGYGTHVMGGAAWGGHTCPGPGPRAGQRKDIVRLAAEIRNPPLVPANPPKPAPVKEQAMIMISVDQGDLPKGVAWPGVFLLFGDGMLHHITGADGKDKVNNVDGYKAAGIGTAVVTYPEYLALGGK